MRKFNQDEIVKYKGDNDKELSYKIVKIWYDGLGYFDLMITNEDAKYDGYFYKTYLSVPYHELLDCNK